MFSQRLSLEMIKQQHSFSSMHPLKSSVPQGFPLVLKPVIPESSSPFFLMKLKWNMSKCNGCEGCFQKDSQSDDSMAVIGRFKVGWYPNLYLDGTKWWKLGRAQRWYYHINIACLCTCCHWFHAGNLRGLLRRTALRNCPHWKRCTGKWKWARKEKESICNFTQACNHVIPCVHRVRKYYFLLRQPKCSAIHRKRINIISSQVFNLC